MSSQKNKEIQLSDIAIKENSWLAKLAARNINTANAAIVIGKTIYLHNASAKDFLQNKRWLKHEIQHVKQFQQHGVISFITMYLWESLKKGYHKNKFEIEAREAEEL